MVPPDKTDPSERSDYKVHVDPLESQERLETLASPAPPVLREGLVPRESRERPEGLDLREQRGLKERP